MFEFNFGNLFTATGFLAIAAAIVKFIAIPAVREFLCREKENIDEIVLKRNEEPEKTVDTFNHMIRKSLKSIDSLLGKPFSIQYFPVLNPAVHRIPNSYSIHLLGIYRGKLE